MRKCAMILIGFLACVAAFAHHSVGNFDLYRTVTITGTVSELEWTNPHMWLWVVVSKDDGTVEHWGAEGASPANMNRRAGWTKSTVRPGDAVTVELHPFLDGRTGGALFRVTLPDGSTIGTGVPPPREIPR